MKQSQFIVIQDGFTEDSVLLYSTFSTSLVELERKLYDEIFLKEDYLSHSVEVQSLHEMGFLVNDDYDERAFLRMLRAETLNANQSEPTYYIICPTTGCNARCYYCFERGAVQKRMDNKTAKAVAQYIVEHHDPEHLVIQWFGGEPLLEPNTISYITDYLMNAGINFDSKIITNGYLLQKDVIKKVISSWNVRIIQITVDALHEEYNHIKNYIYDNVDPFDVVMKNIQLCLQYEINVRVRVNFDPTNYLKAVDTVNYLKERFEKYSNFFVYFAPIDSTDIPPIADEFRQHDKHPLIALLDAEKNYCSFGNYDSSSVQDDQYGAILRKYYLTPIPTSCYGGCESSLTIDSLGNIFNCHRLLGHQEYASGNVFTGRINNEIARYFGNPDIDERCETCHLLPICQGGCRYRAFRYGKEHACTAVKGAVKELIKRATEEIYALEFNKP